VRGEITSLRFQKHTPDRVNVYIDNQFAFGLPAVAAARLHVGQTLSDDEVAQLQAIDDEQKVYDRAVRFLSYRPRSVVELRRHLGRSGISEAAVEIAVERLKRQGYLDDSEFARFWVESRQRFKPRGERALRQELSQKGLDAETISAATCGLEADVLAYDAGRTRAMRLASLAQTDPSAFRQKLSSHLLRRGFDYDVVREVVDRLLHEYGTGEETALDPEEG
jgi:regulatory protein